MKLRSVVLALVPLLLLFGWLLFGPVRPETVSGAQVPVHGDGSAVAHQMSDAEMRRVVEAYWATHPQVGLQSRGSASAPNSPLGADAIVFVSSFLFNADGDTGTQIDTVRINVGQTVEWRLLDGFHTVTSGTDNSDPNAGLLFNMPIDPGHMTQSFTFTVEGIQPYFCAPHDFLDMKGVVKVSSLVGVPSPSAVSVVGFASGPSPNPSSSGVRFRFVLAEPGRVRADVVDVRGRFVATIVDRDYDAGTFEGVWDGRSAGTRVSAGTYYLRLLVPGFMGGRTFVVTR